MTRPPGSIDTHYIDALGHRHRASRESIAAVARAMRERRGAGASQPSARVAIVRQGQPFRTGRAKLHLEDGATLDVTGSLPADVPSGYHQLEPGRGRCVRLIVAPRACWLPDDLRTWGWAVQLYAARSRRSWGIGDLADLRRINRWAAADGSGLTLLNPLAAALPVVPQQPSPYFPSSRRFRNPLYLRIEEIEGGRDVRGVASLAAEARRLNGERRIDRDRVFALKMKALTAIWQRVGRRRNAELERYRERERVALREYATFCVLAERFGPGWRRWPPPYRHPHGPAVRRLAGGGRTADRVRFHEWVQFQIDRQLRQAASVLPVMQDLPIGFDADGADAWAFQDVLAEKTSVGAPPDEFNTRGQDWGLPPFVPDRLEAAGYAPFIDTIRACLRHAGGLRIDHVMGLFRLFWIPDGMDAADGVYVRNAADDLLAIVALESRRAKAVIVGEDLGTVEDDARTELLAHRVLSYRLVWFEKTRPSRFPRQALAAITTHDLPTIAGLWSGSDLAEQKRLGLAPNEAGTREIRRRVRRLASVSDTTRPATVVSRLSRSLATAPSRILTATLEDAMLVEERPNMPATTDERPNWSLALPAPIETLPANRVARSIAHGLGTRSSRNRERP